MREQVSLKPDRLSEAASNWVRGRAFSKNNREETFEEKARVNVCRACVQVTASTLPSIFWLT
jgi:hypothetical protein